MRIATTILICLATLQAKLQTHPTTGDLSAGVYVTAEDFRGGRPSIRLPDERDHHAIWPTGFFKSRDIEVIGPDGSTVIAVEDAWGYIDHKKRLIRTFGRHHFKVLCSKGFVLYQKYAPTGIAYYFSKNMDLPILKLSKRNLLAEYADHPAFCEAVRHFPRRHYLHWDEKQKVFLITGLFLQIQ